MKPTQKTIRTPVERQGIGINLGRAVTLRLRPAEPDTGLVFARTDLPGSPPVPATLEHVAPRERRTVLRSGEAEVQLVEHLLAAVAAFEIDNLLVDLDAPELPIGDGSASLFAEMLQQAGTADQDQPRDLLTLRKPITIAGDHGTLVALPASDGLTISYTLDYNHIGLPPQHYETHVTPEIFCAEIAPARTFVLEREAQALLDRGLGKGASAGNIVVIRDDGSILNTTLRFPDEPARHKALDLLGDLQLTGAGLIAKVFAVKSGHADNLRLVEAIRHDAAPPDAVSLDIRDILSVVPHRYPFLLVDRVVQIDAARRATAIKNVTANEPFFQGHFPGRPIMPGVLLIECMAQTSGLLLYQRCADANLIAQLMSVDAAKFRRPVVPGDQLHIEVEAVRMGTRTCKVVATATVDGQMAAEATITFVLVQTPPSE